MNKKLPFEFDNHMTKLQTILGFVYIPIHVFLLPLVLAYFLPELDEARLNLVYFGISICVILLLFFTHLRDHFNDFTSRIGWCVITLFMAFGLDWVLSYVVAFISLILPVLGTENPNDQAIGDLVTQSSGMVKAVAIFLAPIVEEVLFRGVIFGSLRKRSRVAAYVLSIAIFALLHVWQYAYVDGDWTVLVYIVQYVPVSFVLAWCYERSGSIWCPIAFHMFINAMSFKLMEMAESLL